MAYLYILKDDSIETVECELICLGLPTGRKFAHGRMSREVARNEGELYNRSIWFREPNFERARNEFRNYELGLIDSLERKIQKSRDLIKMIEECR